MIIDGIVCLFLAISSMLGKKRGLMKCILNIVSIIISIIISLFLCRPTTEYILNNTKIGSNLQIAIVQKIENKTNDEKENNKKLPVFIDKYVEETTNKINDIKKENIEKIAKELSFNILMICSFIGLFILSKIVFIFAKLIINIIGEIPIIKQLNQAGGLVAGFIEGLLIICIILSIINMIKPEKIVKQIEKSYITKEIYYNNIIIKKVNIIKNKVIK